jgi:hypothetical protein
MYPSSSHGEFCGVPVAGSYAAAPREAGVHLAAGGLGRRCNGAAGQYPVGSWTPCGAAYPPLRMPAGR